MIINKLLTDSLIHTSERIVVASEIIGELAKSAAHQLLNIDTLLLGDSRGETESINATTNTDTGGVDWSSGINVSSDLVNIHVRSVLGIRADSMIVLDESIEDPGEVLVAMAISSVDTAVLIVEYKSICNSLDEGEPAISCRLWHSIRGSRSRCTIQTRQNSALDKTGFPKFVIFQLYISFRKYSREFLKKLKVKS